MDPQKLSTLRIAPEARRRPRKPLFLLFSSIVAITLAAAWLAWPRKSDEQRLVRRVGTTVGLPSPAPASTPPPAAAGDVVLTVSGYIINRERIEISPRIMGIVEWIGVRKGDKVAKDEVIVRLDDAEQKARLHEAEGRLAMLQAAVEKARVQYERNRRLHLSGAGPQAQAEDSRLALAQAAAAIKEAEASVEIAKTQLAWMVIRSPIAGVVLEKLANMGELVMPQSFGGTHGPSTSLMAVADPNDLQVEVDVNESDLAKVAPGQKCRVFPEAYPEKKYDAFVAEIAPEANRQKGTLQIKVQVVAPDRYLTPELTAKVEFLK